ncbi:MAG: YihA family ribosome biogenesis GTP-binding protein [Saprospiraceae bacterium]|nr:YihA family ribosome biogenesis GTP-binding protein [Saprospiraceae bacterium]
MINDVAYIGSYPSVTKIPSNAMPQYAFVGRSNVGKSSLINMLTDRKALARVSKQPGKTQMINLFAVDNAWCLVDLPGYGYAKQSKKMRNSWNKMVRNYLLGSNQLQLVFCLIDSNIPLQTNDLEFINWMGSNQVPFAIVYTKIDRVRKSKRPSQIPSIRRSLLEYWEKLPPEFQASAITKQGRDAILNYIADLSSAQMKK